MHIHGSLWNLMGSIHAWDCSLKRKVFRLLVLLAMLLLEMLLLAMLLLEMLLLEMLLLVMVLRWCGHFSTLKGTLIDFCRPSGVRKMMCRNVYPW